MTAPDFAAIIRDQVAEWESHDDYPHACAAMVLAANVPELCQTCDGSGMVRNQSRSGDTHVDCPDCPTIGRLLAIGAAVMTMDPDDYDFADIAGHPITGRTILSHLRAVQP